MSHVKVESRRQSAAKHYFAAMFDQFLFVEGKGKGVEAIGECDAEDPVSHYSVDS